MLDVGPRSPTPPPRRAPGCAACPNAAPCGALAASVAQLARLSVDDLSPASRSRVGAVLRHYASMKRSGCRYPDVTRLETCWLHDKWGVVGYLADHAHALRRQLEGSESTEAAV